MDVHVTMSGPVFDGRAGQAVRAFLTEATDVVAEAALADVHHILDRSIRHPTPYYETQIMSQRVREDMVVHDRGIIYGPWLEGVGSRNATTRFKGYAAFRRATQIVQGRVAAITAHVLRPYLQRMGG